jgi:hypothetical protein
MYVGLAASCAAVYLAAAKWIERRVPTEFSLPHALPVLGAGLMGGIALVSLTLVVLWLVGVYQPEPLPAFTKIGFEVVFALAIATHEEILFRGLLFRLCSKIVGTWGALLVSAAAFGAAHGLGSDAPLARISAVAVTGGLLLGAAYAATGRLWLPIGLHWGWDFADSAPGQFHGPTILTGGLLAPDASIVAVIVCLAVSALLLRRMLRLRRSEPPVWRDLAAP